LKEQIHEILEAIEALENSGETSTQQHQQRVQETQVSPPYGLPPNYTPPIGFDSRKKAASYMVATHDTKENEPGTSTFTSTQGIGQLDVVHVSMEKQPEVKPSPHVTTPLNVEDSTNKLEMLEERLRAIEGVRKFEFGNAAELCLVPDVVIPPKFKLPEFENYQRNTCPKNHITMYYRKMTAYVHDEKLLIHFFQESLTGMALNWYMHLEPTQIRSWKDLVAAFVKQYEYNDDNVLDRFQLQNMEKNESETFKEYALRWREIAAQVEPPLHDKELVAIFINTLQSPFYKHMMSSVSLNLADLIIMGERIELGIKNGKIALDPNFVANLNEYDSRCEISKERRANLHPIVYPQMSQSEKFNQNIGRKNYNRGKKAINFTHIPMTYTELLPNLRSDNLINICPTRPVRPLYPKNYDLNTRCDYHGGPLGHSTEACMVLKHKVQSLIDSGLLTFEER